MGMTLDALGSELTRQGARERVQVAMRHGAPARVPVMCQPSVGFVLLQTGVLPFAFATSNEVAARALVDVALACGLDGLVCFSSQRNPATLERLVRVEPVAEGEVAYWVDGRATLYPRDDNPRPWNTARLAAAVSRGPADLDPAAIDPWDDVPEWMTGMDVAALALAAGRLSVHASVAAPFSQLMGWLGIEGALVGLVEQPDRAVTLLQVAAARATHHALAHLARGVDAIYVSDAYASADFLSPRQYARFVLPYNRALVDAVHARDGIIYVHTCGAIGDRLELLAEAGFDGLDCLDPPPLGTVDLAEAKRRVGDRLFMKGNVDPVNTLLLCSRDTVYQDALARIQAAAEGGGYILSSACSLAPRTPRAHVLALVEAAAAAART